MKQKCLWIFEWMTTFSILVLLTLFSVYAYGQSKNADMIGHRVAEFCVCANQAKDQDELDACGEKLNSLNTVALTKADSLHLISTIKSQCGDVFKKRLPAKQAPPAPTLVSAFLTEDDLKGLYLQKTSTTPNAIDWKETVKGQVIRSLYDNREIFATDSLAEVVLQRKKSKTLSDDFKKIQIQDSTLQSLQVYAFRLYGETHMYQIYARKNKLVCFLTITVNRNDMTVLRELFIKLNKRLSNF